MKQKRAQAWGFDLMIAIIIFTAAILIFYAFSLNNTHETEETLDTLGSDGNNIADNLLSPGYPDNWTSANVIRIGILTDDKMDETKLKSLDDLAAIDYARTKLLLDTKNDYYISFSENITLENKTIDSLGQKSNETKNLIRTTRLMVYKERPIVLYVNVWD